jgi:uncharacterized protein with HEPN domain
MRDDHFYVLHILECIERIERYTGGRSAEGFFSDTLIQDGVIRNLQVLAESTMRISERTRSRWPAVAWRDIGGFRNVVVHDYLGLDLERIWHIVSVNLPVLKEQMEQIREGPE